MRLLPTQFTKDQFTFTQETRGKNWAVYRQEKPGAQPAWELVIPNIQKAEQRFGKDYPQRETYPTSEQWGTQGWSFRSREAAHKKWKQLRLG